MPRSLNDPVGLAPSTLSTLAARRSDSAAPGAAGAALEQGDDRVGGDRQPVPVLLDHAGPAGGAGRRDGHPNSVAAPGPVTGRCADPGRARGARRRRAGRGRAWQNRAGSSAPSTRTGRAGPRGAGGRAAGATPSHSTGRTSTELRRPYLTSIRTQSSGSSSRRWPASSRMSSQLWSITTSISRQLASAESISSPMRMPPRIE